MPTIQPTTPETIQHAVQCVKQGGLIAYPTETVYGLGVDPFNPQAIERIFAAKGRAAEKGLILLIRGVEDLDKLVLEIPPIAQTLINTFWPGPLTLIFKARPDLPPNLLGGYTTVALRHSSHPIANQLLTQLGGPLTSTSANRSGDPPAQSAQEVQTTLGDHLDYILEGGPSSNNQPSTLIDISQNKGVLLREGSISRQRLSHHIELIPPA